MEVLRFQKMITSYDVGSLPLEGNMEKLKKTSSLSMSDYFRERVVQGFIDKVNMGIDIPNYPQYRDMNEMFLEMMDGIIKTKDGYEMEEKPTLKPHFSKITEMEMLRLNLKEISEKIGKKVQIKMCVTGPYTLSALFTYPNSDIFILLAEVMVRIIQENVFKEKHGEVCFLSLDEPLLGMVDDVRLDFSSQGREILIKAWETIFYQAKTRSLKTSIHLHNTTHDFFWQVRFLDVIESHVDDPFYTSNQTKKTLEKTDKFTKASISITNFDVLVRQKIKNSLPSNVSIEQRIGEIWKEIKHGKTNPEFFLEDVSLMEKRLNKVVKHFGVERVIYAGPECGLGGFPSYNCALECLRRTSQAIKNVNKQLT